MRVVTTTGMLPAAAPSTLRPIHSAEDTASLTGTDVVQELCAVASPAAEDPGTDPMAGG